MVVEAFKGEARCARGGLRNVEARLVLMEEASSSNSELCSVAAMVELGVLACTHHRVRGRARESESE